MEKKNSLTFCIHILGKVILMYHLVHSMLYDILPYSMTVLCCAESLSSIPLFVIPWTVAHPPAPGSSVHGILQARILEWVTMPSSSGSSQPRD